MQDSTPYLSVVAEERGSSRNFPSTWEQQAKQYGLSLELIVTGAGKRNAGIRQARGEFILATAIDDVCSDELMEYLASQPLMRNRLYRADRHDGVERVWAREGVFPLTRGGYRANTEEDISSGDSGIHFEAGWFPAERLSEAKFGRLPHHCLGRFFGEEAEVVVPQVRQAWAAMDLDVEPGPGTGGKPSRLQIVDWHGAVAAEWEIARRTAVRFWVPPASKGVTRRFYLRTLKGGLPTPFDLHIYNFRCLEADWVDTRTSPPRLPLKDVVREKKATVARYLPSVRSRGPASMLRAPWEARRMLRLLGSMGADVFGDGIEYWGEGWSYLEQDCGETFRWAATDAELVVRLAGPRCDLLMLVEPGPGVGGNSFMMNVQLPNGEVLGRAEVRGTTYLEIPLPEFQEPIVRLAVGPEGGAKVVQFDSRVLGFRIFACACWPALSARRRERMSARKRWTTVTRSTAPAEIDWAERLRGSEALIAGMGKPRDLHLNACGDFILMAREHWLDLRGFPELDLPQADRDALLCVAAHHAGIVEEVLPAPMYVQRPDGLAGEPADLSKDAIWAATQMRRWQTPTVYNLDGWGMAG